MQKGKEGDLTSSVYKDGRGEIRRLELEGVKFNTLFTKKGVYRSGDYHSATQFDLVLKGIVEITMFKDGKDVTITKRDNESIVIPPNVPHLFYFPEDTVMLEWWDKPFEAQFYEPYRKRVMEQFDKKD